MERIVKCSILVSLFVFAFVLNSIYGGASFVFEVLDVLKEKEEGYFDKKDELKKLEDKWIEKLLPFEERGYNEPEIKK